MQLLAQIGDADVHQLVGVERVLGVPGIDRGMGGLAVEGEVGADRGIVGEAVAGRHLIADVQVDDGVDILEVAGAHDIGPADQLLLGGPERDDDAARDAVAHHRLLHREGGGGHQPAMGVVPLHVTGRARHQRLAGELHGGLRAFRQRIDLADDGDRRMAAAEARPQIGRHPGGAELDGEAAGFEHVLQELGALEFLHAELGEIVDRIADLRHRGGVALDDAEGEVLLLVARRLAGQRRERTQQRKDGEPGGQVHGDPPIVIGGRPATGFSALTSYSSTQKSETPTAIAGRRKAGWPPNVAADG